MSAQPNIAQLLAPYLPHLLEALKQRRVVAFAGMWREIIETHPGVDEFRRIAFDYTPAEAQTAITNVYPLARFFPNLSELITNFQFEMRRKR